MADEDVQKKKGGKLKWVIMILVLLLAGGGVFVYFTFFAGGNGIGSIREGQQDTPGELRSADAQMVKLPTFIVNLSDPLGRRILKVTLDVEMRNAAAADELNNSIAQVQDTVILLLSSKSYADLAPFENKLLLKSEIVNRLNQVLGGPKVLQVYFTEMVIQ